MMKIIQVLTASALGLASMTANSAIWLPDVNTSTGDYQEITFLSIGADASLYDLVLFDAGTTPATEPSSSSLTIASLTGIVQISANPAPYFATFGLDVASLGSTAEFQLALWDTVNSVFILENGYSAIIPGNSYTLQFGSISGQILGVDLAPVPVPAAVWLFGSGLIGLVGVARHKKV